MPFPLPRNSLAHRGLERSQLSYTLQIFDSLNGFLNIIRIWITDRRLVEDGFQ